jgi:riboflavin synthase
MFTGLIQEIGTVQAVRKFSGGKCFRFLSNLKDIQTGASIAVNGVCQTVTKILQSGFEVEAYPATLDKTTLINLKSNDRVNLEPAMKMSSSFDGHLVQGHVNAMGSVVKVRREGQGKFLLIRYPEQLTPAIVPEGSVAIDGVSLTIAAVKGNEFFVNLISQTLKETTLGDLIPGKYINLETDVLLRTRTNDDSLTFKKLASWGY